MGTNEQHLKEAKEKTYQLLNGSNTSQGPEITIGDLRELILDTVQTLAGNAETSVGTVASLGLEAHGGEVGTAVLGVDVIGSGGVPGETQENGAVGAVIVVLVLDDGSDGVVDLLVVEGLLELLGSGHDRKGGL